MIKAVLHRGDGIGDRVWLKSIVKTVQQGLENAGHRIGVDGRFGSGTRRVGQGFQSAHGLTPTGIIDRDSWAALADHLPAPSPMLLNLLAGFHGDLDWVHEQEGFRGRPYWPGGNSGVTLDPGVDLGHASEELIETLYGPLVTRRQMAALRRVFGFKGTDARDALNRSPDVQGIRISAAQGLDLMPHTAKPYWNGITRRFPALLRGTTPASVQTVLLSLAYNRGIFNRHLGPLAAPLTSKRWRRVAAMVGAMQQGHALSGIRRRRRQEGLVINAEMDFLNV